MIKIKLCGLSCIQDVEAANELEPDYVGVVFAKKSRRYVSADLAAELKQALNSGISMAGVFVNENPEKIAELLERGTIDLAQLHGDETDEYVRQLRCLTDKPIIQAFRIRCKEDCIRARNSLADYVLLDSGAGTGKVFDWELIKNIQRPYFLAGGLDGQNVREAVLSLRPFGVDVSSGIETDGRKDKDKMAQFVRSVRSVTILPEAEL